jgi:putative restriction endonuclease
MDESQVRAALFEWLEKESGRNGGIFTRQQLLNDFSVAGERIALVGPRGIWIPKQFESIPISITTASRGPYEDSIDENLLIRYKYFGNDPNHRDNVGLKQAMLTQTPLVYFLSPSPDNYQALWPVYIIEDHPETLSVTAEIKAAYSPSVLGDIMPEGVGEMDGRQYRSAVMRQRIHQQAFRIRVLYAYDDNCTACYIKHTELLDAAHIIPDGKPHGEPVVPNGLSLCKIHHAAFDSNILGINPNYIIEIRGDVLKEHDGPMLKHGLQELNGQKIILPRSKKDWPDKERLDWRHEEFRRAG